MPPPPQQQAGQQGPRGIGESVKAPPSPAPSRAAAGTGNPRAAAARRALRALLWDTIDPGAAFRKQWDALLMLQLVFLVLEVPFVTAFAIEFRPHDPLGMLEIIIDITFALDILINFRTGILDLHTFHVNYHRRSIPVSYLRGWFLPDVLSALPYEWMLSSPQAGVVQLVKVARMAKLLRMLRLVKLLKMHRDSMLMHQVAYILGPNLLQLMQLTLAAVALNHVVACFFYYAATVRHGGENWVQAYGISDESMSVKYTASLYFAVSTLGTVGFGDVRAVTTSERIVALVAMVIGITVFASYPQ